MNAFTTMITAEAPEKTRTYTPILHTNIISQARKEIGKAGFKIVGEDYRCTANGQIAVGTYCIEYKPDPDIELMAAFMNSYDKSYAFRFALGANVKASTNSFIIGNDMFSFYKKFHKGEAGILSSNSIATQLLTADKYWETLVKVKDAMKSNILSDRTAYQLLGHLFFDSEMLTGYQMNIIKEEMKKTEFEYRSHPKSLWSYFNYITHALKEAHPSNWLDDHNKLFDILNDEFTLLHPEEGVFSSIDSVSKTYTMFTDIEEFLVLDTKRVPKSSEALLV